MDDFKVGDKVRRVICGVRDVVRGEEYVIERINKFGELDFVDLPTFGYNPNNFVLAELDESVPEETIEIGGVKYLKSDFENAVKNLKPVK